MKFNSLLTLTVAIATILFTVSCDDNITTIGQGIQPGLDDIDMEVGEITLTAETVQLNPAVYLRTDGALLGVLDDPIMGKTKSEFLAEFYLANAKFESKEATIDSVFFSMQYANAEITGDSLSTMGVSIYELNKDLKSDFYTNIKPTDYSDMKTILGQRYFRHTDLDKIYNDSKKEIGKHLYVEMEKSFGQKLYDVWKVKPTVLDNKENLREVLKGIYVTSDFNNKALIETYDANAFIQVLIFYSYLIKKVNGVVADSTAVRALPLRIAKTAIQLNSIIDTPSTLQVDKDAEGRDIKTFAKAPAGVVTKITIPLAEIRKTAEKNFGQNYIINSAVFKLIGMTEEEEKLSIKNRPATMLFINEDSLSTFFSKSKKIEDASTMMMFRHTTKDSNGNVNGSNNTYHFNIQNTTSLSNNISALINHYIEKEKKKENLVFYVIPVDIVTSATSSGAYAIDAISNTLKPSAAIFRTDSKNMKMSLMYSKYKEIKK